MFYLVFRDVGREILCCKYNEEFNYLAAGCSDGSIILYSTESCKLVDKLQDKEVVQATAPVTAIQHRPVSKSYPISNCFTCTCMYFSTPFFLLTKCSWNSGQSLNPPSHKSVSVLPAVWGWASYRQSVGDNCTIVYLNLYYIFHLSLTTTCIFYPCLSSNHFIQFCASASLTAQARFCQLYITYLKYATRRF